MSQKKKKPNAMQFDSSVISRNSLLMLNVVFMVLTLTVSTWFVIVATTYAYYSGIVMRDKNYLDSKLLSRVREASKWW